VQALGIRRAIDAHRIQHDCCAGTLCWQLNDCWPVASWSSIDYYGNWKALHYRAQSLFADNVDLNKWEQYYKVYPKDRTYPDPRYTVSVDGSSAALKVNITAQTDLYDLYIDTDPHIDGHFSQNFFDLKAGETVITFFYPADSQADVSRVKIKVKTLNEVMRR